MNKQSILFSVVMALGMSVIMSLVMTAMAMGLGPDFLDAWIRTFAVGFIAAVPAAVIVAPIARRIVEFVLADGGRQTVD